MREIKFRAWLYDHMEEDIIIVEDKHLRESGCGCPLNGGIKNFIDYGEGSHILMQYTGLKDKNGKEIYEGDILKYYFNKDVEWKRTVKWSDTICGFSMSNDGYYESHREIIGNVHENKELLDETLS